MRHNQSFAEWEASSEWERRWLDMGELCRRWNRAFLMPMGKRKEFARRIVMQNLRHNPKGKGNRWRRRVQALDRQPGTIIWPYYAF